MTTQERSQIKRGVSLYSYQEEYYTRAMTLEDCFAELASMGTEGVELIAEQMVPNYPNPPQSWVDAWHRMMDKYHLKPVCMDVFVDTTWGGHRQMSVQESVDMLVTQMQLCNLLGFKVMRPTTGPVADSATAMIYGALPFAEKLDVKIAVEIHSPIQLRSKYFDDYLDLIAKTGTKHFGFTLDLGIFCKRLPKILIEHFLRKGASDAVAKYLSESFVKGTDLETRIKEVQKLSSKEVDLEFAWHSSAFGPSVNEPKDLPAITPYIYNIHGKFYEMLEDMTEYSIPYDQVIPVLLAGGCPATHINSEFEGQRLTQDAFETDSCEQIRRHQLMLKQLLGEI
jgi:hypothetical protein